MSARAHFSAAALSEAASGRKLPSLQVTLAYVKACGGDATSWEARWREIAAAKDDEEPPDSDDNAPYVGLAAFQTGDADRFFGREALIADVLNRVREHRIFAVFGASGSGKSSILRAGLATQMPGWKVVVFTPGPHPIDECAVRLAGALGLSAVPLRAELAADPRNLHLRIRQANTDLLLIVDQFEELFTLCQNENERHWLIVALTTAAFAKASRLKVVLGVRADFYAHCGQHPELVRAIRDAQLLVGPMTTDELRLAITEPAAGSGCRVETALVARLISDAAGQPAVLPMVSHALLETWRRRRGTTLTLTGYESAGGIQHALSRTAEDIYAGLDHSQQEVAKRIFLRLIALGDGTEDTKRRIGRHELADDTASVLDRLATARLVTLDRDTVELTHEALIRHWPRLRGWLTEDRAGQRIHQELADATTAWESLGRDPGALYRGARLTRAQDWAAAHDSALTDRERDFLHTSVSSEVSERRLTRNRRRRSRQLVTLLAVLLLVASAATGYAISAKRTAAQQRETATQQRKATLSLNALRVASLIRPTNPALAMQLTRTAYFLDPTLTARDTLHEMFATPYAARLTELPAGTSGVTFSRDGKLAATARSDSGPIGLWDIHDPHRPRELPKLTTTRASSVAFSPVADVVATFGGGIPRLWDIADPEHPRELTSGAVAEGTALGTAVAFSPDGLLLATVTVGQLRLWNLSDLHQPRIVYELGIGSAPLSVAFSRVGHLLAVNSDVVRLIDVTDPRSPRPVPMRRTIDGVFAVAFSPTAPVLATAGSDAATRLWELHDPADPVPLAPMTGQTGAVLAVAYSADGRLLATGSDDRTVRVWDVSDPRAPVQLTVLTGHTDVVRAVSFAPDGHTLATASAYRSVRLEDISAVGLAANSAYVYAVAFSADGSKMAIGSGERTMRLWNIADRDHPRLLATIQPAARAASMIFSPDGRFLVTTGVEGPAQLWDISDPTAPRPPVTILNPGIMTISVRADGRMVALTKSPTQLWNRTISGDHTSGVALGTDAFLAAFGPDSRTLATADVSGVLRLFDIADPDHPRLTATVRARGYPMAFSGDGHLLAVAHQDGTTRLWNVSDLNQPREVGAINTGARSNHVPIPAAGARAAFSPDARKLVTSGGSDRTARLWDISDPRIPKEESTLRGHTADVLAVAFNPDGHTVATAGNDHLVHLWETNTNRLAAKVCEIAYPRITREEWDRYFPGLEYQPCG